MKPKIKAPSYEIVKQTLNIIEKHNITTVCYASKCPNISECFKRSTATFMILGNICTRNCKFCNIPTGHPFETDITEPKKIASAVKELDLKYVVITSVDRDDLDDFGSGHFLSCVNEIKKQTPEIKIECLTPDFNGDVNALNKLVTSKAYKLAHNIETVEKLHKKLKPKSSYSLSLKVLEYYSKFKITKSSIIVGLGESVEDIKKTLLHLKNAGVKQLTIGQYLQPSKKHYKVAKYYTEKEFEELKELAVQTGFEAVVSGTLIRSSYYADIL